MSRLKGFTARKYMVLIYGSFHVLEGGDNKTFRGERELWKNIMSSGKVEG
jgi:hypothetical protein